MFKTRKPGIRAIPGLFILALITSYAVAGDKPFGDEENVKFARTLWAELKDAKLVGKKPNSCAAV